MTLDIEIERKFKDLEQQLHDERQARMQTTSDVTRLMTVVFGNPDLRIKGMANQLDSIVAAMDPLADWINSQRRFLGFFGVRDLASIVGLLGGVYTLGSKMRWW